MPIDYNQVNFVANLLTDDPDVLLEGVSVEEESFINAMIKNLGDSAPILIFADWLDEHSDPRGEIYRRIGQSSAEDRHYEINALVDSIVCEKPVESWAEVVDSDVDIETGYADDPGVYPSGAGGYARAGRNVVENAEVEVVFRISRELALLFAMLELEDEVYYNEIFEGNLKNEAQEALHQELPGAKATWEVSRKGDKIIYSTSDVDTTDVNIDSRHDDW